MTAHDAAGEIADLSGRYGEPRHLVHTLEDVSFRPLNRSREAEVAMAIRRPGGRVLLQTKESYPRGIFRIPTGGLKRGEEIERALLRETEEETALDVEVRCFAAILDYYSSDRERVFRSYLFLLDEVGGVLKEEEPDEGITGWVEADATDLGATARQLRATTRSWRPWGRFRALAIDALLPALE